MGINVRQKGQEGEREIARTLNRVVAEVRASRGLPPHAPQDEPFQRNQLQSAVGGDDLTNPFGLSIEIKRQEQLAINSWWKQSLASAARSGGRAILMFRQNRKPWRIMLTAPIPIHPNKYVGPVRVEIDMETFLVWFKEYYEEWIDYQIKHNTGAA